MRLLLFPFLSLDIIWHLYSETRSRQLIYIVSPVWDLTKLGDSLFSLSYIEQISFMLIIQKENKRIVIKHISISIHWVRPWQSFPIWRHLYYLLFPTLFSIFSSHQYSLFQPISSLSYRFSLTWDIFHPSVRETDRPKDALM